MNLKQPAVAFVSSRSGTGKTTLMEGVIHHLNSLGYRTGTVKHSSRSIDLDREGSDTWRLTRAGSAVSVIAAPGMLASMRPLPTPALREALTAASTGVQIILVEGYKESELPKIEVYRSGFSGHLLCRDDESGSRGFIAVASDVPLEVDLPVLPLNDPGIVAEFIAERIIRRAARGRKRD